MSRDAGNSRKAPRPGPPTIQDWLEHVCLMIFVVVVRLLPARVALWLGGFIGRLAFDLVGFRRGVTLRNLTNHLGDGRSRGETEELGRRSYMHFGMSLVEYIRVPALSGEYVERYIDFAGLGHLDRALEMKKGAVLVTGHLGSWELMGAALSLLGYPMNFVVGVQRNPLVQDLMNDIRRTAGIGIIEPGSLLAITRKLRSNQFVAMLSDQDAGPFGLFVDFLGEPASTPQGAARIAEMTGAPVIPGFIVRLGGLRHRIVIERPIEIPPGMEREEAVAEITRGFTDMIASYVRRQPDHYLWAHRRWRTRPDGTHRGD